MCEKCDPHGIDYSYKCTCQENNAVSSSDLSAVLDGPVDLLRDAINIMDEGGNEVPEGSTALWDDDWQALRDKIFKAYEALNQKAD